MHTRHSLKLCARIDVLLQRELGLGIEPGRMLAEPLYARDVLLVCDALHGSEGADLAARLRRAMAAEPDRGGAPSRPGFGASRFLGSLFGPPSTPGALAAPTHRSWFARARSAVAR